MKHYAIIAEGTGVDELSVGSELVSAEGRVEMHLVSLRPQRVALRALNLEISLDEGETIRTEISRNFSLPELIETQDLHGTFHCHTTYSDGRASVQEMASAARVPSPSRICRSSRGARPKAASSRRCAGSAEQCPAMQWASTCGTSANRGAMLAVTT